MLPFRNTAQPIVGRRCCAWLQALLLFMLVTVQRSTVEADLADHPTYTNSSQLFLEPFFVCPNPLSETQDRDKLNVKLIFAVRPRRSSLAVAV